MFWWRDGYGELGGRARDDGGDPPRASNQVGRDASGTTVSSTCCLLIDELCRPKQQVEELKVGENKLSTRFSRFAKM